MTDVLARHRDRYARIKKLRATGLQFVEIARELGVTKQSVSWTWRRGPDWRPAECRQRPARPPVRPATPLPAPEPVMRRKPVIRRKPIVTDWRSFDLPPDFPEHATYMERHLARWWRWSAAEYRRRTAPLYARGANAGMRGSEGTDSWAEDHDGTALAQFRRAHPHWRLGDGGYSGLPD